MTETATIPDDAHHAVITDVAVDEEDEKLFMLVTARSLDENLTDSLRFEIPKAWLNHIGEGSAFNPLNLTDDWTESDLMLFRKSIANRRGEGWLQRLVFNEHSVSRIGGRDPSLLTTVIKNPANIDDYLINLKLMLQDVECLMLRRRGEVWDLLPRGDYRNDDKRLQGYVLAWERVKT